VTRNNIDSQLELTLNVLKLESVLDSRIHVLNLDVGNFGEPILKKWTPTKEEIKRANEVYIDDSKKAVFKVSPGMYSGNVTLVIQKKFKMKCMEIISTIWYTNLFFLNLDRNIR